MIIFDDFLPNSNLRKTLTSSSLWDDLTLGLPFQWADRDKNPSNPFEHLCHLVWNEVVGIKQNIDGWEYWAHYFTAQGRNQMNFHQDNDLEYLVTPEKEDEMLKNGEIRTTKYGFIYYAHQTLPKGGYLEIKNENEEIERIEPVPNRLIIFDPSKKHRVAEVKYGVRKSIVSNAWDPMPSKYRNIIKT
jgi:hypothetical protein